MHEANSLFIFFLMICKGKMHDLSFKSDSLSRPNQQIQILGGESPLFRGELTILNPC